MKKKKDKMSEGGRLTTECVQELEVDWLFRCGLLKMATVNLYSSQRRPGESASNQGGNNRK